MNNLSELFDSQEDEQLAVEKKYKPNVALIKELLGFVPQTLGVLGTWEPSLLSYFLLVPNFLDLPKSLLYKKRKVLIGLAMYQSSKVANCTYCTAHSCTFAHRRGAEDHHFQDKYNVEQWITKELALSTVTGCRLKNKYEIHQILKPSELEAVVSASIMMGFLNQFMRSLSPQLEQETSDIKVLQRVDNLTTAFQILRHAPRAIAKERLWIKDMPVKGIQAKTFLKEVTGCDYEELAHLKPRQRRALRKIITLNTNPENSVTGIKYKLFSGLLFAKIHGDPQLYQACIDHLQTQQEVPSVEIETLITRLAHIDNDATFIRTIGSSNLPFRAQAMLLLTWTITLKVPQLTSACFNIINSTLSKAEIIEIITWNSIQESLRRLHNFQHRIKLIKQ